MRLKHFQRLLVLLATLCMAVGATAQGMFVKPMSVETQVKPGTTIELPFEVINTLADQKITVDGTLEFLGQNEGGWYSVPKAKIDANESKKFKSCLGWTSLVTPTFELNPTNSATFKIRVQIPSSARGFYSAALLVQNRRRPGAGMGIVVRFLIPILIQVEGPVPAHHIEAKEANALYAPANEQHPASVTVGVLAANQGGTLIRVGGKVELYAQLGKDWSRVSGGDVVERRIIPGAAVRLATTINKRIPSGKYRVVALFQSEGRPLPRYVQEIDVKGDPNAGAVTLDTPVVADPSLLGMEVKAGTTRTSQITFSNPGDEAVTISLAPAIPNSLQGVALGNLHGDALSGAAWTTVAPAELVLGPKQSRNVRIVVALPEDANRATYYTTLQGKITKSGEPAGTTQTLIAADIKGVPHVLSMHSSAPISVTQDHGSIYNLMAAFGNDGTSHTSPSVVFTVTDAARQQQFKTVQGTSDATVILPLSIGRFSALVDAAGLKPGVYVLNAKCQFDTKSTVVELPIRVLNGPTGHTIVPIKLGVAAKPVTKKLVSNKGR